MAQRKMDQTTSLLHDPARLKALLLATKRGMVNKLCEEFGISPAAYYRIIDKVVAAVATATEHTRAASENARKRKTDLLLQRLRAMVLAHPTWGCDRLAAELSRESPISGPSVQKLLNQEGLKGRRERIDYVFNVASKTPQLELTSKQLDAISMVSQEQVDMLRMRTPDTLDIIELCIPIVRQRGRHNVLRLYIALDSYFVFGELCWNVISGFDKELSWTRNSPKLATLARKAGFKQFQAYTLTNKSFSAWSESTSKKGGFNPAPGLDTLIERGRAPRLGEEIKRRLFAGLQTKEQCSQQTLQSALDAVLLQYNTAAGKPDWLYQGKSPAQIIGLTDSDVHQFLGKP